jgi:hypothetical protein
MVLYVLIALVAVVHSNVADIGVLALPLRVEAVLQTILVFPGGTSPGCCCLRRRHPRLPLGNQANRHQQPETAAQRPRTTSVRSGQL